MKKQLGFAVKASISIAILALIARNIDGASLTTNLSRIDGVTIAIVMGLILFQTVITAYRWLLILRTLGIRTGFGPTLSALFVSLLLNQGMPSYVGGDAYRAYWVYADGNPLARSIRSVLLDRVTAIIALVGMMTLSLPKLFFRG